MARRPTREDGYVPRRDLATIDAELRLLAAVRSSVREQGGPPPTFTVMDKLLDERSTHSRRSSA